ncbi:MAG: hypothetical protein DCC55_20375 [Chloroflexi bacterium]|nr:MAG: hypothetical protein DCC55_20375 [Chloroflexota bacterium]
MQLEESNIIGIDETSARATAQVWSRYLRILGSILLLITVWYLLFIWGLIVTQQWLAWWTVRTVTTPDAWQAALAGLLQTGSGLYLPACVLVLISLALFFYRVPRVSSRLTVPLEFGLITLSVLALNALALHLLQQVTHSIITATAETDSDMASASAFDPSTLSTELGLAVTVVLLAILFWLQATGLLRSTWFRWRRRS